MLKQSLSTHSNKYNHFQQAHVNIVTFNTLMTTHSLSTRSCENSHFEHAHIKTVIYNEINLIMIVYDSFNDIKYYHLYYN